MSIQASVGSAINTVLGAAGIGAYTGKLREEKRLAKYDELGRSAVLDVSTELGINPLDLSTAKMQKANALVKIKTDMMREQARATDERIARLKKAGDISGARREDILGHERKEHNIEQLKSELSKIYQPVKKKGGK